MADKWPSWSHHVLICQRLVGSIAGMNAPLIFLAVEVATIVCALLLAVRVIASRPRLRSAQLIALIGVNTACAARSAVRRRSWVPGTSPGMTVVGWEGLGERRPREPAYFLTKAQSLLPSGSRT